MKGKYPLVLIEWQDSAQPVSGWTFMEDLAELGPVSCRSVGWLLKDGDDVKLLAANIGGGERDEQACGVIRILTSTVTSCRVIEP